MVWIDFSNLQNKKKPAGKPSGKASPKAKGRPGTGQEIDYGKPEPVTAPAPESIQVGVVLSWKKLDRRIDYEFSSGVVLTDNQHCE